MSVNEFIAPPCAEQLVLLYQDRDLLVINKPSGLLSLSGKNPLNKDSVHYRIVQQFPSATMIHRLDFGTSGVMVLALNKAINAHLCNQFQSRSINKEYIAMLQGRLADEQGVIEAPLAKDTFPYQKVCHQTGKASSSRYRVIQRRQDPKTGIHTTRVIFTPVTGRTHQLRVHSREIGHPIIGCDLYGLEIDGVASQSLANRLCLHASTLEFEHPTSGNRLSFTAKCDF
jgi:tRNA pseudouridine32 synthase/23S rRNA pseudouridine746 synthase